MRRSALIGILLTLLSALLVLGAAFIFLFQGRQTLEERVTSLEQTEESLNQSITGAQASLATRDASLVALEGTRTALVGQVDGGQVQLGELQQQNQELQSDIIERDALISQLQTQAISGENQPPLVVIFAPEPGQIVPPGRPVEIVISASDPAGIASLNVLIDDTTVYSDDVGGLSLYTASLSWTPTITEGTVTLRAVATNIAQLTNPPADLTITITDPETRNSVLRSEAESSVSVIRGLESRQPVDVQVASAAEWEQQLAADLPSQQDTARHVLALSAFNFFPPTYTLYETNLALAAEKSVGFYDPLSNELVIAPADHILSASEQWLYAEEYAHALQDQYYRLDDLNSPALDSEGRLALQALAEGDARLVQFFYRQGDYFSSDQLTEIAALVSQPESGLLTGAPRIVQATRAFLEDAGQRFVQRLYDESGWAAVNNAWTNPPISTEQILHPQQYLDGDLPQAVTLPALAPILGSGWQPLAEEPFGEFYLREYLAQQVSQPDAEEAAAGWGGGRFAVYQNDIQEGLVMVLRLRWDTTADDNQFADTYTVYATTLAGNAGEGRPNGGRCWQLPDDFLCHYHVNEANFIVRAPDMPTAELVIAAMQTGNP